MADDPILVAEFRETLPVTTVKIIGDKIFSGDRLLGQIFLNALNREHGFKMHETMVIGAKTLQSISEQLKVMDAQDG